MLLECSVNVLVRSLPFPLVVRMQTKKVSHQSYFPYPPPNYPQNIYTPVHQCLQQVLDERVT
jgi:hypothetical protein